MHRSLLFSKWPVMGKKSEWNFFLTSWNFEFFHLTQTSNGHFGISLPSISHSVLTFPDILMLQGRSSCGATSQPLIHTITVDSNQLNLFPCWYFMLTLSQFIRLLNEKFKRSNIFPTFGKIGQQLKLRTCIYKNNKYLLMCVWRRITAMHTIVDTKVNCLIQI